MTYDDRQIIAPLVICEKCGHAFYMVKPQPLCRDCRQTPERTSCLTN